MAVPHYALCIKVLLIINCSLFAHDLGLSAIEVHIQDGHTRVIARTHVKQLELAGAAKDLSSRVKLRLDGELFVPVISGRTRQVDESGLVEWEGSKPGTASRVVADAPLFPEDEQDKTLVSVYREGQPAGETIMTPSSAPSVVGETGGSAFWRFIPIGVEHILFGPDHVAFLLALLLPGGRFRSLLAVITAFTIAHSITLALAVLGLVQPVPWLVEGVIALSIVAAAGENLLSRNEGRIRVRALYAGGFGLVHGFGFAGALGEVGLPLSVLGWALAGFNVGVEIGQLAIVLVAVPLLARLPRRDLIVKWGSILIMLLGAYWTVQRLFLN